MLESVGKIESEAEARLEGKTDVSLRIDKIKHVKAGEKYKAWLSSAQRAEAIYQSQPQKVEGARPVGFNIFHANIEVRTSAVYNSTPTPDIRPRHSVEIVDVDEDAVAEFVQDQFVPPEGADQAQAQQMLDQAIEQAITKATADAKAAARKAEKKIKRIGDIVDRTLRTLIDLHAFDRHMSAVVKSSEVVGRGVPRIRLANGKQATSPTSDHTDNALSERLYIEHVPWDKFTHGPALSWESVPWVCYEHDLSKDEVARLLSLQYADEEAARLLSKLPFGKKSETIGGGVADRRADRGIVTTVRVYEIWDVETRTVSFIAEELVESVIHVEEDPLSLRDFFPSPRPLYGLQTDGGDMVPVCPYDVAAPLYEQVNSIAERIKHLTTSLKVVGLHDPAIDESMVDFQSMRDGQFKAIGTSQANSGSLGPNGTKIEDLIWYYPIDRTAKVIGLLYEQLESIKQRIYEVTGISDILRGASNAAETLGAQEIKAAAGSQRISGSQRAVQDMCRDLMRMMAEVATGLFSKQTLELYSGLSISDEELALLREKATSVLRIDIETDSTVRADLSRQNEAWTNFLNGTAQFFNSFGPAVQVIPKMAPGLVRVYGAFLKRLRVGKDAEDEIDRMVEAADEFAKESQTGQDSALERQAREQQMEIMQADQQRATEQHQMMVERHDMDMQSKREIAAIDLDKRQQDQMASVGKHQRDIVLADKSMEVEGVKAEASVIKAQADIAKAQIGLQQMRMQMQGDELRAAYDAEASARQRFFDATQPKNSKRRT